MPDITMCIATNCKKSTTCRRHEDSGTKPNIYVQSWCNFSKEECAAHDPVKGCRYYWEKGFQDKSGNEQ